LKIRATQFSIVFPVLWPGKHKEEQGDLPLLLPLREKVGMRGALLPFYISNRIFGISALLLLSNKP
jgi:hypothetical protein